MTKRDETVFAKAFAKMEAKGCFTELRAKNKAKPQSKSNSKPMALKSSKKLRSQASAGSVSGARSALSVPIAANKR